MIWGFWPPEPSVALRCPAGGHSLGRLGPSSSYNPKGGRAKGVPEPGPGLAPLAPTLALWSDAGPPTPCVCPSSGGPARGREKGAGWGGCKSSPTLPQSRDGGNLNTAFPSLEAVCGDGAWVCGQHTGCRSALAAVAKSHRGRRTRGSESLLRRPEAHCSVARSPSRARESPSCSSHCWAPASPASAASLQPLCPSSLGFFPSF